MYYRNKLEDLREEKNLKSKDLADYFKVNKSTYSEWEHNKIPIPTRRLLEIANFYKVNIDYILNFTDEKKTIKYTNIDLKAIGNRLKEIRKKEKLSLRQLQEKLNISFSSIACYERGERLVKSDILIGISKLSNCSIDWILGRSNDKYIKEKEKV